MVVHGDHDEIVPVEDAYLAQELNPMKYKAGHYTGRRSYVQQR